MVTAGSVITFAVNGTTGEYLPRSVGSVRALVIDGLTPYFDVEDVAFQTASLASDPFHALSNWPYTATVRAVVRADYGDIRDVDSIIVHAFYDATGNEPTVTADDYEAGQGAPDRRTGFSLTTVLTLAVIAIVALAVIKVKS